MIDLQTYRLRIGLFSVGSTCRSKPMKLKFEHDANAMGIALICTLLVIGGLDLNPGPHTSSIADDSRLSGSANRCCKCVTKPCIACSCVKHGRQCINCRFGERCPNRGGPTQQSADGASVADYVADLKRNNRVLPRIPKASRIAVAGALAQRITAAVVDQTPDAWRAFLSFAYAVLIAPESNRDKSNRKSLASTIRHNLISFENDDMKVSFPASISLPAATLMLQLTSSLNVWLSSWPTVTCVAAWGTASPHI